MSTQFYTDEASTDAEIFLRWLFPEKGTLFEIRVFGKNGKPVRHGYFDDPEKASRAAVKEGRDPEVEGVYVTLNPVRQDKCPAGGRNRMTPIRNGQAVKDGDIVTVTNMLIDVDVKRETKTSSTGRELSVAYDIAWNTATALEEKGWDAPLLTMSGNGYHLYYRVKGATPDLIRSVLQQLNRDYGMSGKVEIDQSVHNPSRITKVPGTWVKKGEDTEPRPHRESYIVSIDPDVKPITEAQLQAVISQPPGKEEPAHSAPHRQKTVSPGRFYHIGDKIAQRYGEDVIPKEGERNTKIYDLPACPWADEHSTGDNGAAIFVYPNGDWYFNCLHDTCQKNGRDAIQLAKLWDLPAAGAAAEREEKKNQMLAAMWAAHHTADLFNEPEPEWRFAVSKMALQRSLMLMIGAPGAGKSYILWDLAMSIISGKDWLHNPELTVYNPGPVLWLDQDAGLDIARLQSQAVMRGYGLTPDDVADGFHLISDTEMPMRWDTDWGADALCEIVEKIQPSMVVIDAQVNFLGEADENSSVDMARFYQNVRRIFRETTAEPFIVVPHHEAKSGDGGLYSARGSGAITASVDTQVYLWKKYTDSLFSPVMMAIRKARLAPIPAMQFNPQFTHRGGDQESLIKSMTFTGGPVRDDEDTTLESYVFQVLQQRQIPVNQGDLVNAVRQAQGDDDKQKTGEKALRRFLKDMSDAGRLVQEVQDYPKTILYSLPKTDEEEIPF